MSSNRMSKTALVALATVICAGLIQGAGAAQEPRRLQLKAGQPATLRLKQAAPAPQPKPDLLPVRPSGLVAAPGRGGGSTPSEMAELIVTPYYSNPNSLPIGFPTHSYCSNGGNGGASDQLRFYVRNVGGGAADATQMNLIFPTSGDAPAFVVPALQPNQQVQMIKSMPSDCYTPGFSGSCQFRIEIDAHNEVSEFNEANNEVDSYCVAPAG